MTTHILSMTYQPKIEGVRNGTIRQTIRKGKRVRAGDFILFHGWANRPYRSKWTWRERVKVLLECPISFDKLGFKVQFPSGYWRAGLWEDNLADQIAKDDGISPPTGQALKETLEKYHGKFTDAPVRFQVIRW